MKPHQWALAFGDPDDPRGGQLLACPRCNAARGDLELWLLTVASCPRCRRALESDEPIPAEVLDCDQCMAAYGEFERWLERVEHYEPLVALELAKAEELLEEISGLQPDSQLERVKAEPVFRQWGFCQRLLAECRTEWTGDRHRARLLARLGTTVADLLAEDRYHALWVADLRAKAYGYLANTSRLLGDYRTAEREFVVAERWVERGLGAGRAEATVLRLKASLLLDQYRHLEAEAVLDRVLRHYRENAQVADTARTLLKLAMVSRARELHVQAVERVEEALSLLDPEKDSYLVYVATNNLVLYRIDAGAVEAARALFEMLPEPGTRLLRIRRTCLEGDLRCAEGDLDRAARLYDDVRIAFLAEDLHYDVALVSLNLAVVATLQGRAEVVRELARDAIVLLTRSGAPQEAFAALRLLVDSLERDAVSVAFIQQIARKLARLQPSS
jgi:tetratricopeptide (TPR) repeat protein